jgi:hypothetical protein
MPRGKDELTREIEANDAWVTAMLGIQQRRFDSAQAAVEDSLREIGDSLRRVEQTAATLTKTADSLTAARVVQVADLPTEQPAECLPWITAMNTAVEEASARELEVRNRDAQIVLVKKAVGVQYVGRMQALDRVDSLEAGLERTRDVLRKSEAARRRAGRLDLGVFTLPRPPAWTLVLAGAAGGYYAGRRE